jgi:hypothetical protein
MMRLRSALPFLILLCAPLAYAHVGSTDVYAEGQAGPYELFVVVRPPLVIPGVADLEVRSEGAGLQSIAITPVPLTGEAAKHPPVPETMVQSKDDPAFFTGHLWIMAAGSWQIRLMAHGSQGDGVLSIPLPATALGTRPMTSAMGFVLGGMGLLLLVGMVGIVGAAAREARLPAGAAVPDANRTRGYLAMGITLVLLVGGLILGNTWWKAEAAAYSNNIYKPLGMSAVVGAGGVLDLKLHDPGWLAERKLDDFVPDHDHLMHLYMIRWPEMDEVAHLHPQPVGTGEFQLTLPSLPAGDYHLYADVVHENGFPETIVGELTLPAVAGRALAGDDAVGTGAPVKAGTVDPVCQSNGLVDVAPAPDAERRFKFADGYTMVWHKPTCLSPRVPVDFQFELLDADGKAPKDMALYMGMLGHAAFVKTDGTVFAHIHPTGTVSMAAFMLANPQAPMKDIAMPGMAMDGSALPNAVGFPYGFPSAGAYRIFVQMKHGSTVETGVFDVTVGSRE